MRERFHYFILVLSLGLVLGLGCSKKEKPAEINPEPVQQTETVPAPQEPAPAPTPNPAPSENPAPSPVPNPSPEPAPVPVPAEPTPEKPAEKTDTGISLPFWPKSHPTPEPVVPPVKEEPLRVYYQKDPLPETWLGEWTAVSHVTVVQAKFSAGSPLPKDGDLYLFTPDVYPQIVSGPGTLELPAGWARAGLDPVFTGHPFDVDNVRTRPLRWTPYLLYGRTDRKAPWKEKRLTDLWPEAKALWPDQVAILAGLTLKDAKSSANPHNPEQWDACYRAVESRLHDKLASEADCWAKIQSGEIDLTILPASYRLMLPPPPATPVAVPAPASVPAPVPVVTAAPASGSELGNGVTPPAATAVAPAAAGPAATPGAGLDWTVPPGGTLIYFEQLAIGSHTKKKDETLALGEFLLKVAQQKRLLPETGYFSVRTKPGTESQVALLKLPRKDWFNQSEFLDDAAEVPKGSVVLPSSEATPFPAAPAVPDAVKETPAPVVVPAKTEPATP